MTSAIRFSLTAIGLAAPLTLIGSPLAQASNEAVQSAGTTFTVSNTNDTGNGSLRWAIEQANAHAGMDRIDFAVTGTIKLSSALPPITDGVHLEATPTAAGAPQIQVDFNGATGLRFAKGSAQSSVSGLSLAGAGGDGLSLEAGSIRVSGNYIGVGLDGTTVQANRGDGVRIGNASSHNIIGTLIPPTETTYTAIAWPQQGSDSTAIQGIRASRTAGSYVMTGSAGSIGLVYEGPVDNPLSGVWYTIDANSILGGVSTSVYGPDIIAGDWVRLVGSMRNSATDVGAGTQGFVYTGKIDGSTTSGYQAVSYPGATFTYLHSTSRGLVVGNYDSDSQRVGKAFIYDSQANRFIKKIRYPGSHTTTAYGIVHSSGARFTIAGGYGLSGEGTAAGHGYMVDYDAKTGKFSHWKSFDINNQPASDIVTHFDGISANPDSTYTLAAFGLALSSGNPVKGALATVYRNQDGGFSDAAWTELSYQTADGGPAGVTLPTSVAGGVSTGVFVGGGSETAYAADSQLVFQRSNVISGNRGNGIGIYGGTDNRVYANYIGTDAAGSAELGNGANGILVTERATRNLIGGKATGGNDPTANIFFTPPQGNLISANAAHGVQIDKHSRSNTLAGNFIGTDASGNKALGNKQCGVAIIGAGHNALLGTTFEQPPFVFYNVISGNGEHGLRVQDSDNVTVQANFFGIGANNSTVLANRGNGILVQGASKNTQVGGVIPLGNVAAGNGLNGIEVRDRVSGFISFNTFGGLFAFGGAAPNQGDGILVTATGGNNLLRTNVLSGNNGNGLHIGGAATGVTVDPNVIGLNTKGDELLPNGGHGVLIDGEAHHNVIGGNRRSVIPQNTFSGNRGYGIAILGGAHHNQVFNSYIGTSVLGDVLLGNDLGGVLIGDSASQNSIGGLKNKAANRVNGNFGNGISLANTAGNKVAGNTASDNTGSGIYLYRSADNAIVANSADNNGRYGYESVLSPLNTWIDNTGFGNTLGLYSW
ncbi:MAG: right-handed parallel beta-helix repeat-containing protein [Methylococcus sp.]|nr:right-handed parallel beta-helix repeat-containing protein [Methylococcus sp.]